MLTYKRHLKTIARQLRRQMTSPEQELWFRLRSRQLGVQFYRQKPLGSYIVDFYSPAARLVIELDGAHHANQTEEDAGRSAFLSQLGLTVIRFTNRQVFEQLDEVVQAICGHLSLTPPLKKGEGGI